MTYRVQLGRFQRLSYESALCWQQQAAGRARLGMEALAVLEHEPVYTLGRRGVRSNLLLPPEELAARGAPVVESDRGGNVTFHGPGQLVAYPILNLRQRSLGALDYVRRLEQTMIECLAALGVAGERVPGRAGVWTREGKIGAVGVRIEGGVSRHGLALNVAPDLSWFDAIVPCGLPGARVTSIADILGRAPAREAVEEAFLAAFEQVFDSRLMVEGLESVPFPVLTRAG